VFICVTVILGVDILVTQGRENCWGILGEIIWMLVVGDEKLGNAGKGFARRLVLEIVLLWVFCCHMIWVIK